VGDAADTPACNDASCDQSNANCNWLQMTDPAIVNITEFNIDDSNSITAGLPEEDGSTLNQSMREIEIRVTGALVRDNTITREINDTIRVRNDFLWKS